MDMRKAAAVLLWFSMVGTSFGVTATPEKRPVSFPLPAIKKDCSTCHVTEGAKTTARLNKNLPDLCLDCHPDRVAPQEHRVGIAPSGPVKKLPLTDGTITCVTCHDPHKNPYGALLRLPETELCLACHPY